MGAIAYNAKRRTAAQAAELVRSTDLLAVGLGPCQPQDLLVALGGRDDWQRLQVFGALFTQFHELFTRRGVQLLSGFFGPVERALRGAGADVQFIAADFRRFAHYARRAAPRIMATTAAMPDAHGRCSLALHAGATVDELHRAGADPDRLLIVEVNPKLPRTLGLPPDHMHGLSVDEIDVIIESEADPFYLPDLPVTDVERGIAEQVRRLVPDGATLQTGIGGIPSAVVELLAAGDGADYGIHSEMFTSGLKALHAAGKVSNRKGVFDGFSAVTFAAGNAALYEWLDEQPDVRFLPVEVINDPSLIARNRQMISINGALSIDLAGQIAADNLYGRQFSGIGGHEDFVTGASFSPGGRSLVCLPSTAMVRSPDGDHRVSRLVDGFAAGAVITTPRHQVDVVITEWGAAELAGRTDYERAIALAEIAHPEFRDALREAAQARRHGAR